VSQYPRTTIALHWGVLLLIAATYAMMELRGIAPRGILRDAMKVLHYSFGLTVFALVFARIVIRLRTSEPPITPPLPWHMKLAATGTHLALYGFMIVMPVLGWATLSAEGKSPIFFGIPLFPITPVNDDLADFFEDAHELVANLGYFLIGAHAAAALYHHYIRKDNTLTRMAPFLRR
jgi:cytochrome b561